MNKQCVIILYDGATPSQEAVRQATEALLNNIDSFDGETVDTYTLNQDEIAQALLIGIRAKEAYHSVPMPEIDAIDYIMESITHPIDDVDKIMYDITGKYVMAALQGTDPDFINAIKTVVDGETGVIVHHLVRNHKMRSSDALHFVKEVSKMYNNICLGHIAE